MNVHVPGEGVVSPFPHTRSWFFNHPFPPYLTPLTVPLLPSPSSFLRTSHPQENFHWFGSIVAVLAAFAVVAGYGTYKLMVSR